MQIMYTLHIRQFADGRSTPSAADGLALKTCCLDAMSLFTRGYIHVKLPGAEVRIREADTDYGIADEFVPLKNCPSCGAAVKLVQQGVKVFVQRQTGVKKSPIYETKLVGEREEPVFAWEEKK